MINNIRPKISVIIPVLNEGEVLSACLASVASQNYEDYEIIVVDNGSTDDTPEIIENFAKTADRIVHISESQRGRSNARNAGIAAARGEIIAMTDADCVVPADWLSRLVQPIIDGQAPAASGFENDAIGNYWSKMRQEEDWRFLQAKIKDGYINHVDTKNFAIKADLLKDLEFDPRLTAYEDWDLFIRLKKKGVSIMFLPEVRVAHRHDASLKELLATQFSRGQGVIAIIKKYRPDAEFQKLFKDDASALSGKARNFWLFIPWVGWQLISDPKRAPYRVAADLAWKLGMISAYRRP